MLERLGEAWVPQSKKEGIFREKRSQGVCADGGCEGPAAEFPKRGMSG